MKQFDSRDNDRSPAELLAMVREALSAREGAPDPLRVRESKITSDAKVMDGHDLLAQNGLLITDRHKEDFKALAGNPRVLSSFLQALEDYQRRWGSQDALISTSVAGIQTSKVMQILLRHSFVQKDPRNTVFAVPLAVLIDLANKSLCGPYMNDLPAVSSFEDRSPPQFFTLSHSPFWRDLMAKRITEVCDRFIAMKLPINLVMVGDGSGENGAAIALELTKQNKPFRIIHVDLSPAMLELQSKRYTEAGVPQENIISVKSSVIDIRSKLRPILGEPAAALFFLHEVFDDLRTHTIHSIDRKIAEIYTVLGSDGKPLGYKHFHAFEPTHPILAKLVDYLPFYCGPQSGKLNSFCPEAVIALREMLGAVKHGAIYVGDYGGQFMLDLYSHQSSPLPVRAYQLSHTDNYNPLAILSSPVNLTADVCPSLLYMSEAFGGKVETLSTQRDFLAARDPDLATTISTEITNIRHRAATHSAKTALELLTDMATHMIANRFMFAGIVTKALE